MTCSKCHRPVDFDGLESLGVQSYGGSALDLRNHDCGTTLARVLFPSPYPDDYPPEASS